ncbi:hypothetical protein Cyast_0180 [Cyanobacterium stanieri PCC 7202]|uniref:Uncharacterized protein n=1 Tax=Cyanobacterium stanieri (strain ATCC 29140 / PCC 7202) TaxID=292563 RepID=K9YJ99_CYASC|nr:hypothetical protein Cyast_0180 [Cyanobacterium stanieri PCC 7202]
MSKIEEVKGKIRDGDIDQAMAIAMSEALKIEIVTSSSQDGNFRSTVNLLENEIEHELGESLDGNNNSDQIKQLHFQEVENANQRILQNIQSLQTMFNLLQENS